MHIQRRATGKAVMRKLFPGAGREETGTVWKAEDLWRNKSTPKDVYGPIILKRDEFIRYDLKGVTSVEAKRRWILLFSI